MIPISTVSCLQDSIRRVYQMNKNKGLTDTNNLEPLNTLKDNVQPTQNIPLKHLNTGCDQRKGQQQPTPVLPSMQQPCNLKTNFCSPYFYCKNC